MKKALALALALATAISLSACGGGNKTPAASGSTSTAAPTGGNASIVLKVAHVEAEDRSTHKALLEFEKEVEEKSDGRIDVQIYPNAELGGDEELCEAVAMGTIQMALPSTSVLTSYNEEIGVLDMPYLFKDSQSAFDALDGDLGSQISEWIAGNGFVSLGYTYNGPRCTTNSVHPISTPADLAGLKIRVMSSPVFIRMYEVLGANPTLIYASGFQEVQKYLTLDNHVHNFLAVLTNENWLNSLSADDQQLVKDCVAEMVTTQRSMELEDNDSVVAKLQDAGMEVNELTDEQYQAFVDAVQPMYDEYKQQWGTEIFDLATSYNK